MYTYIVTKNLVQKCDAAAEKEKGNHYCFISPIVIVIIYM